jgi:hypothetical protein
MFNNPQQQLIELLETKNIDITSKLQNLIDNFKDQLDFNITNQYDNTPLHFLCMNQSNPEIYQIIIDNFKNDYNIIQILKNKLKDKPTLYQLFHEFKPSVTDQLMSLGITMKFQTFHDDKCSICLENWTDEMKKIRLPCGHIFCHLCIIEKHDNCGICRKAIKDTSCCTIIE